MAKFEVEEQGEAPCELEQDEVVQDVDQELVVSERV